MKNNNTISILMALLAAVLYAVSIPCSKLLLVSVAPVAMSAFLYLGAGVGVCILYLLTPKSSRAKSESLTRKELPYTIAMILLDIAAPVCLMLGLSGTTAANASLLSNFEIAATTIVALVFFRELISRRLWLAIALIMLSSMLLSFEDLSSLDFSYGSLFVILACVCWGFENNCTRMMSSKNTFEIVILKGVFSGLGALAIALISGEALPAPSTAALVMLLGFASYGLSIFFYVRAQNKLGAAKTSAFYAVAPFVGAFFSFVLLREAPGAVYYAALAIMLAGAALVVRDTLSHTCAEAG